MKLEKLFSITTVPLLLSSLLLVAPVSANPVQLRPSYEIAQNLTAPKITRFARISEISGSTVTVIFRDGSSQDIQVSSEDMESMNLMQSNYVIVTDNKIVNVVQIGEITEISGSTVTVSFDNHTSNQYQVSPGDFQALNLEDGFYVGVVNNQIVGVSSVGKIVSIVGSIATVRLFDGDLVTIGISRRHKIGSVELIEGQLVYVADNQIVAVGDSQAEGGVVILPTNNINSEQQEAVQVDSVSLPVVQTQEQPLQPVQQEQSVQPVQQEQSVQSMQQEQPTKPVRGLW